MAYVTLRRAALLSAIAPAAGAFIAPAAQADDFTPQNLPSVPTSLIRTYPLTAMQPAYPRSTSVYQVSADVANADGFDKVTRVKMCWYITGATDHCDASDPRSGFVMTWDPANSFVVEGTSNNYQNASSDFTDVDATTKIINFKFKISDAMLAGTDWNLEVTVYNNDINGDPQSQYDTKSASVGYYSYFATSRVPYDYGDVLENPRGTSYDAYQAARSVGSFLANGNSSITAQVTDFTHSTNSVVDDTLTLDVAYTHKKGTVEMVIGNNNNIVRRMEANKPQTIYENQLAAGTGETPDNTFVQDALIKYYGGAKFPHTTYTSTLTIGVGKA